MVIYGDKKIDILQILVYNSAMKILIVDKKYNNKKVIDFIKEHFPALSSSTIYKTLRKRDIRVNNNRISENCLLKTGDEIKIYIADDILEPKLEIPIVYEDENIIVFNKPIGLEVTGSESLTSYAQKNYGSFVEPCHRLDRNTSGLTIFAKNQTSYGILLDAFKNHLIEKHYIALVSGIPMANSKRLEAYLFKDSKKALVYISDKQLPKYQKIITHYKIIKSNKEKNICLLDVTLETGRTHQIRAHLAHIGHPIIGDGKYGKNEINKAYKKKTQLLSSYRLIFHFSDSNILSYLNNVTIKLPTPPFSNFI
ncbi:MAG: RluA family pseudouridine synthase [Clostridia bacterium]|nr:RluA family pseudouridine synthase [Clostridia bacterium]